MSDAVTIETIDLRKRYDGTDALDGLDLRVPGGSIFGFLGRNGAGKTTTMKILLGMAKPTAGAARVFGLAADGREAVDIASDALRSRHLQLAGPCQATDRASGSEPSSP